MTTRDYEMFSPAGNRACESLVQKVIKKLTNNKMTANHSQMAKDMLKEGLKKISEKHGEVYDSEPRYHIAHRVNKHFEQFGIDLGLDSFNIS